MLLKTFLFIVVGAFGIVFGNGISAELQVSLIEGVKNSAAILFGVVGGWMALVYPEELKAAINSATRPVKSASLFKAFYLASLSLGIAIVFPTIELTALRVAPKTIESMICRGGFAIVLIAVLLQIWVLLLVLQSTELIRRDGTRTASKAAAIRRLLHRNK